MSANFGSTSSSAGSPYSSISTDPSSPATSTTSPGSHPYTQSHGKGLQYHPSPSSSSSQPFVASSSPLRNQHTLPHQSFQPSPQQFLQQLPQQVSSSPQLDSYTQALQIQAQQNAMAATSGRNRSISPLRKVTSEEMAMTLGWGGIQQFLGDGAGGHLSGPQFGQNPIPSMGQGPGQGQSQMQGQVLGLGTGMGYASPNLGMQQQQLPLPLQGSPVQQMASLSGGSVPLGQQQSIQQQQYQQYHQARPPPQQQAQQPPQQRSMQQQQQQQQQLRQSISPRQPLSSVGLPTGSSAAPSRSPWPQPSQQARLPVSSSGVPVQTSGAGAGGISGPISQTGPGVVVKTEEDADQNARMGLGIGVGVGVGVGIGVGAGMTVNSAQQPQGTMSPARQTSVPVSTSPKQPPPAHIRSAPTSRTGTLLPSQPVTQPAASVQSSAAPSRATSVGMDGPSTAPTPAASDRPQVQSRSEPPKRLIDIDHLPISETPLNEMKLSAHRNRLMLQGDPQIITKQRVETAIRVILDLLRSIPLPTSTPPLPLALQNVVPPDPTGVNVYLERPSTFKGLMLQAGTTTKAIAKKQLQAGKTAAEEVLYLETAVYMSGENGKRVYACKRCRLREERRRANKDAARKKQAIVSTLSTGAEGQGVGGDGQTGMMIANGNGLGYTSYLESQSRIGRMPGAPPPSLDYITSLNAEQYDPHNKVQVVEEPKWDPHQADWRHEIVLFNSSPEVPIKDGSCMWLPFRVVCYGKCHGEKLGFRIKFTLRTVDGTIIATSFTDPIRITDDHKTDTKAKPKVDGMTSTTQPAVARGRKSRPSASAASSRRQSPAPSDAESVQSMSEAGAVLQKQTPSMRTKPYDRPLQSPATATMPPLPNMPDRPPIARQQSNSSLHSLNALTLNNPSAQHASNSSNGMEIDLYNQDIKPFDQPPINATVSPGALRRPNFGFTSLDGINPSFSAPSAPHSATSSNVASPIAGLRPLSDDMMMMPNGLVSPASLSSAFADMSAFSARPNGPIFGAGGGAGGNEMVLSDYLADQDMASTLDSALDNLFDVSSHASLASSFDGASTSAFSAFHDGASGFYSDSGLVPDDTSMDMEGFLDFSGGQDSSIDALSGPPFGGSAQSPFGVNVDGMSPDPLQAGSAIGVSGRGLGQPESPTNNMLGFGNGQQAEIQDILSSFSQRQNDPNSRTPEMGMLHHPLSPVASMASPGMFGGNGYGSPAGMVRTNSMGGSNPSHAFAQSPQAQIQPHPLTQMQPQDPIPPQPLVSHVIPAEGPMAGGTQVAIAGQRFAHGMTVLFGTRVAKTTVVSDSFCTCELPPAAEPGLVEVCVQGAVRRPGDKVETFRYLGMDKEMMRLALEVRDQYQGSSSAAAYRLAQRVAQSTGSTSNSESERSSASPMGSGASPNVFSGVTNTAAAQPDKIEPKEEEDLQLTIINFLSSLDKHAPGSFRRSGTVNHRNVAEQTLLHLAVVMGFHRLVRRLILMGASLDLQDSNGFTPLAFASLCGQAACARVLIEAGAAYDRPTAFGEMPLDLAKLGDREEVEALLLSAVWSTTATASPTPAPDIARHDIVKIEAAVCEAEQSEVRNVEQLQQVPHLPSEAKSEIDDDNPSSSSEVDEEASRLRNFKVRRRKSKGKSKVGPGGVPLPMAVASTVDNREADASATRHGPTAVSTDLATAASVPLPMDDPPPYEPSRVPSPRAPTTQVLPGAHVPTWMERTLSNISDGPKIDTGMWSRLPLSSFWTDKPRSASTSDDAAASTQQPPHGWIALPAPSWETLSRLTSPEEVKLFTQAMAAAALSAVVQSTSGTLDFGESSTSAAARAAEAQRTRRGKKSAHGRRSSQSSSSVTPTGNVSATGDALVPNGEGGKVDDSGKKIKSRRSSRREKGSEGEQEREKVKDMVSHVKQDRMLYLFWLPILLFVSFWLLVTALPIITGFGIIYARQITKAIKQRM